MKSIGKHISYIYRHQSILISELLNKYGIGTGQYLFLIYLYGREGINQKELGELVKIDRANTNRAIKKLVSLNYVVTKVDETDKRNRLLYLTEKGREIVPYVKADLSRTTEILSKGIDEKKLEVMYEVFELFEKNVAEAVDEIHKERMNEDK